MFNFFEKNDARIKQDVKNELLWDPSLTSDKIKVDSKEGIVTLTGTVPHYCEKCNAEKAAERVGDVQGVADEIRVNLESAFERDDAEIALAAHENLKWDYQVPEGAHVSVDRPSS